MPARSASAISPVSREMPRCAAIFSCSSGSGSNRRFAVHSGGSRFRFSAGQPHQLQRFSSCSGMGTGQGDGASSCSRAWSRSCSCASPLPLRAADANHRNAQALFQPGQVDGDMPLFRLVQEVDTEQGFGTGLQHLHDQQRPRSRQVASQTTTAASGLANRESPVPQPLRHSWHGENRCGQIGKQNGLAAADSCADGAGYWLFLPSSRWCWCSPVRL